MTCRFGKYLSSNHLETSLNPLVADQAIDAAASGAKRCKT